MSETYGSGSRRVFKQETPYRFIPHLQSPARKPEYTKSLVHMHGAVALFRRPSNRSSPRVLFLLYDCSRSRRCKGSSHSPLPRPPPLLPSLARPGVKSRVRFPPPPPFPFSPKKREDKYPTGTTHVQSTFILRTSCASRAANYPLAHKSHRRQITATNSYVFFFGRKRRARPNREG